MGKFDVAPTTAAGIIRLARTKAGLTQTELANLAGVTQQTVSAYETGRMDPTFPSLERIVGAAGLEMQIRLVPVDDHDASLDHYLSQLPAELRSQLGHRQRKRVEQARLQRVKGD